MKRLVTSLAILAFLMGAFVITATAASLRFQNNSNAYVHLYLTTGKLYDRGFCVAPHSGITEPLQDEPVAIRARFYKGPSSGPSCSGPVLYDSEYTEVWRTDIRFWTIGNDEDSYRFYHN